MIFLSVIYVPFFLILIKSLLAFNKGEVTSTLPTTRFINEFRFIFDEIKPNSVHIKDQALKEEVFTDDGVLGNYLNEFVYHGLSGNSGFIYQQFYSDNACQDFPNIAKGVMKGVCLPDGQNSYAFVGKCSSLIIVYFSDSSCSTFIGARDATPILTSLGCQSGQTWSGASYKSGRLQCKDTATVTLPYSAVVTNIYMSSTCDASQLVSFYAEVANVCFNEDMTSVVNICPHNGDSPQQLTFNQGSCGILDQMTGKMQETITCSIVKEASGYVSTNFRTGYPNNIDALRISKHDARIRLNYYNQANNNYYSLNAYSNNFYYYYGNNNNNNYHNSYYYYNINNNNYYHNIYYYYYINHINNNHNIYYYYNINHINNNHNIYYYYYINHNNNNHNIYYYYNINHNYNFHNFYYYYSINHSNNYHNFYYYYANRYFYYQLNHNYYNYYMNNGNSYYNYYYYTQQYYSSNSYSVYYSIATSGSVIYMQTACFVPASTIFPPNIELIIQAVIDNVDFYGYSMDTTNAIDTMKEAFLSFLPSADLSIFKSVSVSQRSTRRRLTLNYLAISSLQVYMEVSIPNPTDFYEYSYLAQTLLDARSQGELTARIREFAASNGVPSLLGATFESTTVSESAPAATSAATSTTKSSSANPGLIIGIVMGVLIGIAIVSRAFYRGLTKSNAAPVGAPDFYTHSSPSQPVPISGINGTLGHNAVPVGQPNLYPQSMGQSAALAAQPYGYGYSPSGAGQTTIHSDNQMYGAPASQPFAPLSQAYAYPQSSNAVYATVVSAQPYSYDNMQPKAYPQGIGIEMGTPSGAYKGTIMTQNPAPFNPNFLNTTPGIQNSQVPFDASYLFTSQQQVPSYLQQSGNPNQSVTQDGRTF